MIERWTPKVKQEQCTEGMTLRMWTDKEGDYVLYTDHVKAVSEAYHNGKKVIRKYNAEVSGGGFIPSAGVICYVKC